MGNDRERGWFLGCGECGANFYVRNAAIRSDKRCDHMADVLLENAPEGRRVSTELGWCACGTPERVDELMSAYLLAVRVEQWHDLNDDASMLLAYIADELGWTEHGTSIRGAWLTDDGRDALANLAGVDAAF